MKKKFLNFKKELFIHATGHSSLFGLIAPLFALKYLNTPQNTGATLTLNNVIKAIISYLAKAHKYTIKEGCFNSINVFCNFGEIKKTYNALYAAAETLIRAAKWRQNYILSSLELRFLS